MPDTSSHCEEWDTALKTNNRGSAMSAAGKPTPAMRLRNLWRKLCAPVNRMSIRTRVFFYFLIFTTALLSLLWVFQIVLLPDFYRLQKTDLLTNSVDVLRTNIDNDDLQLLADRMSETSDLSILILNQRGEKLIVAEGVRNGIIQSMSSRDFKRYMELANQDQKTIYRIFNLVGFQESDYDEERFAGRVPPAGEEHSNSMVAIRAVSTSDGDMRYIFVNAIITPVEATVQTLRSQFLFIAVLMVLLSFMISLALSFRIAQPLIRTTEAARGLSEGHYDPPGSTVSYREIRQLNATLVQAAADLHRVEEMQRELIANISHDLRTPLTLIEGYAEAMRDLPGENTPENMQVIIEETRRLTSLVNAVLDYNNAQNGRGELKPAMFNLTDSIRRILNRYNKLTEQDGYQLHFEQHQDVWVFADEMKMGQVVYNLVNNAITYTGEDHTVTVRQTLREGNVRVEVIDTGEGIDPEELPYIWSRYYRGHKLHKRPTVGTGLGLSIVQGILNQHHLQYGVESQLGKGSTFWFILPVEEEPPMQATLH